MTAGAYSIAIDKVRGNVVATITGDFDHKVAKPLVEAARRAARDNECQLLYDFRAAKILLERGEIFWFPRRQEALGLPGAGRVRVAVLVNTRQRDLADFLENAYQNAGLQLRVFEGQAEALAWLAEAKP
jgi:hypothetical protein